MTSAGGAPAYRVAADPSIAVRVANLGLACCTLEVEAAVRTGLLIAEDDTPCHRTVLLVSGTVTQALAPAVVTALEDLPPETEVVAFGACATSGGPYWDAPMVVPGVDRLVKVRSYVPGCPPRPEALVNALLAGGDAA